MLLILLLACTQPEQEVAEVCDEKGVSVTDIAHGLNEEQKEVSYIIEQELDEMGITPNITAAAIVNAMAESRLNPEAVGDGGKAVGTFQLHKNGLGKNLSFNDRTNIYTSANIVGVQILKNERLQSLDNKDAKISTLSNIFIEDIMRPANIEEEKMKRTRLSRKIFPDRI
jgi:hypothetical protein